MIAEFSLEGVGKSGAVFDLEKLNWMNGLYLRRLSPEEYVAWARPFLEQAGLDLSAFPREQVGRALMLEQERAKTLAEIPELTEFFFREPPGYDEKGERKWFRRPGAADLLAAVRTTLEGVASFDEKTVEAAVREVGERSGGAGPVIHSLRLAVTGRTAGPGLFALMVVLGKEAVLRRLRRAEERVQSY